MKRGMMLFIFILVSQIGVSCTSVKPWQRARLAQPHMAFDTDPLESGLRQHTAFSKEAASGGYGGGGGGCGCN